MFNTINRLVALFGTLLITLAAMSSPAAAAEEARVITASLSGHTLTTTEAITLSYALTGPVPDQIELRFVEEVTGAIYNRRLVDVYPSGTAAFTWSAKWPAGTYRLDQLRVFPTSLFETPDTYRGDGTITRGTSVMGEHTLDFSTMYFSISGDQTNVMTPPSVSAISMIQTPAEVGDELKVSVTTHDEQPALARVFIGWSTTQAFRSGADTGTTELTLTPPVGRHKASAVSVFDKDGASTIYRRDGSITHGNTSNSAASYSWLSPRRHTLDLAALDMIVSPKPVLGLTATARSGSVRLTWSQQADLDHRVVVSPGGRVVVGPAGPADRDVVISGLSNATSYSFAVTATSGDLASVPTTASATPRMATRVFGTGDRSKDVRNDLWAAPSIPAGQTSSATWRIYQGAGGGKFGRTLSSTIPVTRAPIPGSSTGKGPGAPLGALYLNGGDLIEPTATGNRVIGRGFNVFRTIDASSDLTGDGIADLIGITPAGDFYFYPSTSTGAIGRGIRLGSGWSTFQSVFAPGDFNGDKRSDVVGVDGLGKMWLYPGTGRGGFGTRVQIGSGWAGFGSVLPMRDFSGDGKVDIGAITMDGKLLMYPGNGRGGFLAKSQIGTGWGAFL